MFLQVFFCLCGFVFLCLSYVQIKAWIQKQHERQQVIPVPRMVVPSPLVNANPQEDLENQPH